MAFSIGWLWMFLEVSRKTPIIPVDIGGFFVLKKSGNDDARHISQAAWMHGMRKSLSPLDVSRGDVTDVMVGGVVLLQNPSGEQGPNAHPLTVVD